MPNVSKDIQAFKRTYKRTKSIKTSALAAGYSENVARTGLQNLPKSVQQFVIRCEKRLNKKAQLARGVTPEMQELIVRGSLLANVASGKDQACNSLKMLGTDKRVNMFVADSQTGVIVIQAAPIPSFDPPQTVPQLPTVTIEAK